MRLWSNLLAAKDSWVTPFSKESWKARHRSIPFIALDSFSWCLQLWSSVNGSICDWIRLKTKILNSTSWWKSKFLTALPSKTACSTTIGTFVSNTHPKKNTWRLCAWRNSKDLAWRPDLNVTKLNETNVWTLSLKQATSRAASIRTVCWCSHWCTHLMTCPLISAEAKKAEVEATANPCQLHIQNEAQLSRQRGARNTIKAQKKRKTRRSHRALRAKKWRKKPQLRSRIFPHLCHSIATLSTRPTTISRPFTSTTNWLLYS